MYDIFITSITVVTNSKNFLQVYLTQGVTTAAEFGPHNQCKKRSGRFLYNPVGKIRSDSYLFISIVNDS